MVHPRFANLDIDLWVHPGKLGVAQPSLCLFHDSLQKGTQILDALNELKTTTCPFKLTLTFAGCARKSALSKLKLMLVEKREGLKIMNIHHDATAATIEMTAEGLSLVIDACAAWLAGGEDFGVSPQRSTAKSQELGKQDRESGELWFWGPGYTGP
jgi:hypothetical protein